ncbi:MAG: hypothetical protein GXP14_11265 [Gammaproteobacteria bacterium]|nr:hypothetical protein [Gammaproteobacteria bacterium]
MNEAENEPQLTPQPANSFSLVPTTLNEAMQYAEMICKSSFCPNDFKGKSGDVLVAVQMGSEIGLPPMQALQNIAVINGRPCVWGDALPALAKAHPMFEYINESFADATMTATCKIKRRGEPEQIIVFTSADAKTAGLWGKKGPWTHYPKRMLQMRARGWAIRNVFPDALKGIQVAEEIQDLPVKNMGAADVVPETNEPEQTLLPVYPDDKFTANFPVWRTSIETGVKFHADVVATIESRYTLTDDQKKQIVSIEVKA